MAWLLLCLFIVLSPVWLFLILDVLRKRRERIRPAPRFPSETRPRPAIIKAEATVLEAQFLVAPKTAIREAEELLHRRGQPYREMVPPTSPSDLRLSFEELMRTVQHARNMPAGLSHRPR
ncbi:MAG TPA: hypothetical protein VFX19_05520 [Dehalococcoidia bacterium]|jgi:hypothetical protein|nr:hypothetical protein [Dehalococcoidia bacterium]